MKTKYLQVLDFVCSVAWVPPFETTFVHGGQDAIVLFEFREVPGAANHGLNVPHLSKTKCVAIPVNILAVD